MQQDWLQLLPLTVWGLNDLPGPIQGCSPHRVVFGRDPVGFGDCPLSIPEDGRRDATDFFQQLLQDRRLVQQKLTAIHKRETERFLRNHPRQVFSPGDRVWIGVNRQGVDKQSKKLDRVWKGPAEILARVGVGGYRVATENGEKVLHTRDLKPCLDPLSLPGKPPLHYYTDVEGVIEDNALHGSRCRVKTCPKVPLCGTLKKYFSWGTRKHSNKKSSKKQLIGPFSFIFRKTDCPGKLFITPKMHYFFRKTTTFSFFYHLCFPMKIPMSLQSFPKPVFGNHVARSTTRSIFWHPSLREAPRKH